MTDEQIMEKINDGERNKIALLFDRYHILLYNFFLKRKIGRATSEDLTQNVFLKIIKYSHSFDPAQSFQAWMFRIARNIANDHFTKNKTNNPLTTNDLNQMEDSVLKKIEQQEQVSQLHQAINFLEKEDREIIQLARFQKLKYQEIATTLSISEGAVKTRMYRAMKKLKVQYLKLENQ